MNSDRKKIKLLSLNLHCLEEEDIKKKQEIIVNEIINKDIDIIFLQEVAQYADKQVIKGKIKQSNYGFELYELLSKKGHLYNYEYLPIKLGFNKYDEGLGFLSKYPLKNITSGYLSITKDYNNFRTRKYLKASLKINNQDMDIITTHLGWDSRVESYLKQCENLVQAVTNEHTLIGGDFNIFCGSDYYSKTISMGLIDLYGLNENKKYDYTFENDLDVHKGSGRIDYIFSTKHYKAINQDILFKDQMVSDHYGLFVEIKV